MDLSLRIDSNNNNNNNGVEVEKEHMFDKVVTPSDVGKLNRLVIPKQHAEKYFPLDSTTNEDNKAGLILNFEDPNGKPWRFRYSYWNSSQSYVMTKGWSRFVKHNKLHAGDVVSFLRALPANLHRLFIDSRPRHFTLPRPPIPAHHHHLITNIYSNHYPNYNASIYYFRPSISSSSSSPYTNQNVIHKEEGSSIGVLNNAGSGCTGAKRRLRLFGVNMECATADGDREEDLSNKRRKQPLSFSWDLL